ncbi:stage II sporulation protein M [Thiofilum flexile]|uniref:stage II sporulation protein M n=1 Tax=Thiofilum flexile TaxID=125627 RepID=UPI0003711A38|nr:stage II sporulation protein M [Thiofilum flexile]
MKQLQFIEHYQTVWTQLQAWLDYLALSKHKQQAQSAPSGQFAELYRQTCHHLALAQARHYSPQLLERLNHLVVAGHQQFYREREPIWTQAWNFLALQFPAQVRAQWRVVALSVAIFYGSMLLFIFLTQWQPDLVYSVLDPMQVAQMESMYDPKLHDRLGREREADSDVYMFGHYIRNNTSIGFQAFTSGLLLGVGTLFILLFNGIVLGAVAGHLTYLGYNDTFWGFVVGHSAFELTAIALSGAAGFKLTQALLFPGRQTRLYALRTNGRIAIQLMYGAALLFLMAAFVEAFWSSQAQTPLSIKYTVGAVLWVLTLAWLGWGGRKHSVQQVNL